MKKLHSIESRQKLQKLLESNFNLFILGLLLILAVYSTYCYITINSVYAFKNSFYRINATLFFNSLLGAYFTVSVILIYLISLLNKKEIRRNKALIHLFWSSNVQPRSILKFIEQPMLTIFMWLSVLLAVPSFISVYLLGVDFWVCIIYLFFSSFISLVSYKFFLTCRLFFAVYLKSDFVIALLTILTTLFMVIFGRELLNLKIAYSLLLLIILFFIASSCIKKLTFPYIMVNFTAPIISKKSVGNKFIFHKNQMIRYLQFEYCRLIRTKILVDYILIVTILMISLSGVHLFIASDLKGIIIQMLLSFGSLDICILFPSTFILFYKKNKHLFTEININPKVMLVVNFFFYFLISFSSLLFFRLLNSFFDPTTILLQLDTISKLPFYLVTSCLITFFLSEVFVKETQLFLFATLIVFFLDMFIGQFVLNYNGNSVSIYLVLSSLMTIALAKALFSRRIS